MQFNTMHRINLIKIPPLFVTLLLTIMLIVNNEENKTHINLQ